MTPGWPGPPANRRAPVNEDAFKVLLGIPAGKRLMTLVPVGVPVEWPTKEKKSLAEVIHWERY